MSKLSRLRLFVTPSRAKFCTACFLALAAALLAYPEEVRSNVLSSTLYCLTVLTPSLFPFMALTSFAVNSGVSEVLGHYLGFLTRAVFRLPRVCTAVLLMSFLGGYPAGAKGVSLLYAQGRINREQAGRMMLFCVNPGIAFVVTFLGGSVLQSPLAGWLLFASVTLAGLLLGFLCALPCKRPEEQPASPPETGAGALIRSASDACSAVVKMSACVVLFSGFTALLHGSGAFALLSQGLSRLLLLAPMESSALLSFLIEVTGGVGNAAAFRVSVSFFAFGLAFAGLCVHLQVFSFFREFPVSKLKFFLFRFFHALLAVGIFQMLASLFPKSVVGVLAPVSELLPWQGFSGSVAGGISLLLLCTVFLLLVFRTEDPEKRKPQ